MSSLLESHLNRLWASEKISYGLRIFIGLFAALATCWYYDAVASVPSVFLGVIASSLAETDDNWLGRSKAVLLSLVCFGLSQVAVILLFPYALLFVISLGVATFCLTLLGALGERYASITQATVAISIYGMLGMDSQADAHNQTLALHGVIPLLAGAAWYGVLSIIWAALFANRPVRDRLVRLLHEVGLFLRLKANLFEPVRQVETHEQRLKLAQQNARVVSALNETKAALLSRFGRSGRPGVQSGFYFRLYYMAQEFHERASSSHYPYEQLTEAFFHSDVLYRCQRLLDLQGKACIALAEALRFRKAFEYGDVTRQAMTDLEQSLSFLRVHGNLKQLRLLGSLDLLSTNLQNIERQLSVAERSESTLDGIDTRLRDSNPHTLKEMMRRIGEQLTPKSLLFRHGLRMALALVVGYCVMKLIHADSGYWILLTTAFVCRPNYGATKLRLVQRVMGTLAGLVFVWALMQLFPSRDVQLLLALVAALLFAVGRTDHYMMATTAITVMALLCFNLLGDGFLLMWPRLIDTVLGCAIAAVASFLVLPDWQTNRIHLMMSNSTEACARYLDEVMRHYLNEGGDDLSYRIARRDMHNADAALSAALSGILRDPRHKRGNLEAGFRFMALSNTLLSYLSALGAHRTPLENQEAEGATLLEQARITLRDALLGITGALRQRTTADTHNTQQEQILTETLEQTSESVDSKLRFMHTQLALMLYMLPQLRAVTTSMARPAKNAAPRSKVEKQPTAEVS